MQTATVETSPTPKTNGASKKPAMSMALQARAAILKKFKKTPFNTAENIAKAIPYVASGSFAIDDLIGGTQINGKSKCPGFPRQHISEVFGNEGSGKSTLAWQAVAEAQKAGGWAMWLDYEHAIDWPYVKALGVSLDENKLQIQQPDTLEEGMAMAKFAIFAGADIVVIDSAAAMIPQSEIGKEESDAQGVGAQARAFSRLIPHMVAQLRNPKFLENNPQGTAVVLLNQVRSAIQTNSRAPQDTNTSGGKALRFYAHLRLMLTRIRGESVKVKSKLTGKEVTKPFGNHTQVKVIKNRLDAKAGHTCDIFIRFGQGIDEAFSLIEAGVTNRLIKKEGAWYTYKGVRKQGRDWLRQMFLTNRAEFDSLRFEVLKMIHSDIEVDEVDEEAISFDSIDDDEVPATDGVDIVLDADVDEIAKAMSGDESDD